MHGYVPDRIKVFHLVRTCVVADRRHVIAYTRWATNPNTLVHPFSLPAPFHRHHRQVIVTICSVLRCRFEVYNKPFEDVQ